MQRHLTISLVALLISITALIVAVLIQVSSAWTNPSSAPPGGGGTGVPAGQVAFYGGSTAPAGWLLCNGSSVSTATYPDLFTALGYSYGGSGGTFNLPDLRGRTPVGLGTNVAVDARGDSDGVALANRRPQHRHTSHSHGPGTLAFSVYAASAVGSYNGASTRGSTPDVPSIGTIGSSGSTDAADGGSGNSNDSLDAPAYLVFNCIIKT